MPTISPTANTIVIDASVAIRAVLPLSSGVDALELIAGWRRLDVRLVAPMLWLAECASAIRGLVHARQLSSQEGQQALDDILSLEVEPLPITEAQTRVAFAWASRLAQRRAYDGFYLALAEETRAEFWSADRRLVVSARQSGASWVHCIDDGNA